MKQILFIVLITMSNSFFSQTGYVVNTVQDFSDFSCSGTCPAWTLPGNFCYPNNSNTQQDKITKYFWLTCTANADSIVFTYKFKSNGGFASNYMIQTDILNQIKSTDTRTFTTIDSGNVYGRFIIFPAFTPVVFNVLMTKQGPTSGNFCVTISNLILKAYCPSTATGIKEQNSIILNSIWAYENKIYFSENLKGKTYSLYDLQGRLIEKNILQTNQIEIISQKGLAFVEIDNRYFKLFLQ